MGRKRIEPFNPWPGFVDLFASVIMVVLTFMLVTIINVTYYSQFKYKIGYEGSVPIESIMNKTQTNQKEALLDKQTEKIVKDDSEKELEAIAGMDLTIKDSNQTKQEYLIHNDWILIKYINKEIILEPQAIKEIEAFLKRIGANDAKRFISLYTKEPTNQISASIAKQIALSRALNVRNVLRKKGYKDDKVVVKLKDDIPKEQSIEHPSGYVVLVRGSKK